VRGRRKSGRLVWKPFGAIFANGGPSHGKGHWFLEMTKSPRAKSFRVTRETGLEHARKL